MVVEGEEGSQVAEHQFLLGALPDGGQDLRVHVHLVLLAVLRHRVLLQSHTKRNSDLGHTHHKPKFQF